MLDILDICRNHWKDKTVKKMPKVSVIVPVYNTEEYLNRCIDSILAQTFTDFELLLVDDGSTDRSGSICEEYSEKSSRIRVFHQENKGQAAARNSALDWVFANSKSEYISFIDSDDWVHPRFLELLTKGFSQYDVYICQCRHVKTDGTMQVPAINENLLCVTPKEEYISYYSPYIWEKLYKRQVWEKLRFPEGQIYEDLAIWYKVLFSQNRITIINTPLYYYYQNPSGTMRQDWHPGMLARMDAWDEQIDYFNKLGDENLLKNAIDRYCNIAYSEYQAITRSKRLSDQEKKKNKGVLKRKFRRLLFHNSKEVKINNFSYWMFETSFPIISWVYWTTRAVLEKLKSVF